jgi:acetolactate synthase-1/2/3 large subunit
MAIDSRAESKTQSARQPEQMEGKRLTGAQILLECLAIEGVEVVFGMPGGALLPLYDALPESRLRHVLVRHEQAAAHAADGYARAAGKVGVCFGTSGPGATNLVTGIATAHMDSSPVVAFTGQVATNLIGKDSFQEIDITGITLPITKHNFLVRRVEDLAPTIKEAFHLASTGRKGPVLIDVPKDVQVGACTFQYPRTINLRGYKPTVFGNIRQVRAAAQMINQSHRPLIIAGRGIILSRAYDELRAFADKADAPVITTLLGLSSFPDSHRLNFGMIGMHGMAYANKAVTAADVIIAVGMRYDDRATGKASNFAPGAKMIHIDIDPAEIGKNIRVDVPIVGDVKNVLAQILRLTESRDHTPWVTQLCQWRVQHPATVVRESEKVLPQYVIRQIYEATGGNATVIADVGQNQMWAAQHFWYDRPNSYVTSGGLGTMGFSLPAAIGVQMAQPDETVWVAVGDGGVQMNIQELATIAQENLPIKVAILNNGYLGMVRQWQEIFYQQRYTATRLHNPDFAKLAEAYGIMGLTVRTKAEVSPAIQRALHHSGPVVIDFQIEPEENVFPMVPPGSTLSDMMYD